MEFIINVMFNVFVKIIFLKRGHLRVNYDVFM